MIFFFDRCLGTRLPKGLRMFKPPVEIVWHDDHFPQNMHDDDWLPIVGGWGWFVITKDFGFHIMPNELEAVRRYELGVFYLQARRDARNRNPSGWDLALLFAKAFDKIVDTAEHTPRPFVYAVKPDGRLVVVDLCKTRG